MKAIETTAVFVENGKLSIANLPQLKNQKAKIILLFQEEAEDDFYAFSAQGLANAYSDDEPEYDISMIKELNLLYNFKRVNERWCKRDCFEAGCRNQIINSAPNS